MRSHPEMFTPPPGGATGDVRDAFTRIWRSIRVRIELDARDMASDQRGVRRLVQEARIRLWEVESSRCDVTDRDDMRYIHSILYNHMRRSLAKQNADECDVRDAVPKDVAKQSSPDLAAWRDPACVPQ